jgi:serine-type D-Ala-D-Ala endopeptidase (penicillin-binding protein 7)
VFNTSGLSSLSAKCVLAAALALLGVTAAPTAWGKAPAKPAKKMAVVAKSSKASTKPAMPTKKSSNATARTNSKSVSKPIAKGKVGQTMARAQRGQRLHRVVYVAPPRLSQGQAFGLHNTDDPLELKSSVALVLDQDTNEVLFAKNSQAVLPIASITKLMTALVVAEAKLPLDEVLTITAEDVDTEKGSRSRLQVGTTATREDMLHLALMSSENRAANALGRHYPGGLQAFVVAMNRKAKALGMVDTRFMEPTGLSSLNQSSATDLAVLVKATSQHELIRRLSTSLEHELLVGDRPRQFRNTNLLVRNASWDIGLQKTGYISEAGRCLVMQAQLAGRKLIMVFLDSAGTYSRLGDAERVRRWLTSGDHGAIRALASSRG